MILGKMDRGPYAGKVTTWTIMSADPKLGYLYVPTNTAAPDYYGGERPGDDLFAQSILCLDLATGKRVWHFQTVHHGLWDYDNPAAPNLLDITVRGKRIKALAQISKQGFVYALDRVTGKPIWPIKEKPVPASDVPGESASPTQPFPTKPAPFEYQGITNDNLADFTPEIWAEAIKAIAPYRTGPLFTPPSIRGTIVRPSVVGGGNWGGAAVDPETGMLYVPSRNIFSVVRVVKPDPKLGGDLPVHERRGRKYPVYSGWCAAYEAALFPDDRHRYEHWRACLDGSHWQRGSGPQSSGIEAAQSPAFRRRRQLTGPCSPRRS